MKKLILWCLLGMNPVFAQSVATVLFATPEVKANQNGATRPLVRGASLAAGDAIVTAKGGAINIKYLNGTLVNIGENSRYKIIAYSPQSDIKIKTELTTGKVKVKTLGKVKETLKTPVTALAILGTRFEVFVDKATPTGSGSGAVTSNSGESGAVTKAPIVDASVKVYVAVSDGRVQVGDTVVAAGGSVVATTQGVQPAAFPPQGAVQTPKGADGAIASTETKSPSTVKSSQDISTSNQRSETTSNDKKVTAVSNESQPLTASSTTENNNTSTPTGDNLALIVGPQTVGETTSNTITATQVASNAVLSTLADITLLCQF